MLILLTFNLRYWKSWNLYSDVINCVFSFVYNIIAAGKHCRLVYNLKKCDSGKVSSTPLFIFCLSFHEYSIEREISYFKIYVFS